MITTNENWENREKNHKSTGNSMSNDGSSLELIGWSQRQPLLQYNNVLIKKKGRGQKDLKVSFIMSVLKKMKEEFLYNHFCSTIRY